MHNVLRRAFPGGLTGIAVVLFAELFAYALDLTLGELSTVSVIVMAVNGLVVLYYAGRPLNRLRTGMLISLSAAMLLAVTLAGPLFLSRR